MPTLAEIAGNLPNYPGLTLNLLIKHNDTKQSILFRENIDYDCTWIVSLLKEFKKGKPVKIAWSPFYCKKIFVSK